MMVATNWPACFFAVLLGLLVGSILGWLGWLRLLGSSPQAAVQFLSGTLQMLVLRTGREYLHVVSLSGQPFAVSLTDFAKALERELPLWVAERERSEGPPPFGGAGL